MLVNIADFIALDLDPERMMYTPNAKPSRVTLDIISSYSSINGDSFTVS